MKATKSHNHSQYSVGNGSSPPHASAGRNEKEGATSFSYVDDHIANQVCKAGSDHGSLPCRRQACRRQACRRVAICWKGGIEFIGCSSCSEVLRTVQRSPSSCKVQLLELCSELPWGAAKLNFEVGGENDALLPKSYPPHLIALERRCV